MLHLMWTSVHVNVGQLCVCVCGLRPEYEDLYLCMVICGHLQMISAPAISLKKISAVNLWM